MSVVRLARRRADGEQVAVKCVVSADEEVQQLAREEFLLMRELNHPGIVRASALYQSGYESWMCMEFCSNGSVQSYVEHHGVCQESAALALFLQLLRGVNYLHRKRIVHRDCKPANLLLQSRATWLKIADFNSAKRVGTGGSGLMLTDRGTHLYSAPELRFGRLWNERVDVWACGLCLFFMLRSELPFNVVSSSVAKTLLSGRLPEVRWEGIGDFTRNLIQQCLTVNMQDRPPAMELLVHPVWCDADSPGCCDHEQDPCTGRGVCLPPKAADPRRGSGPWCEELRDLFAWLPGCGLLAVRLRRSRTAIREPAPSAGAAVNATASAPPPAEAASTVETPWPPTLQPVLRRPSLASSSTTSVQLSANASDAGAKGSPRGFSRLRSLPERSDGVGQLPRRCEREAYQGASLLRWLARTKCERTMGPLEVLAPSPLNEGSDGDETKGAAAQV